MANLLSKTVLEQIKDEIGDALLKRGYNAPFTLTEFTDRKDVRLELRSEPFQTVPVIFKSLVLTQFGTSVKQVPNHEHIYSVWISVSVHWKHFGGGTNGTTLFDYCCKVNTEQHIVFDQVIQ